MVCSKSHLSRFPPRRLDIIVDIMWSVEVEPEVEQWMEPLSVREFATVVATVERLAEDGNRLRFQPPAP